MSAVVAEPRSVSGDLPRRLQLNDKMFPRPIRLKFAPERERVVRSAWEGLECLGDWPAGRGRRYQAALRWCLRQPLIHCTLTGPKNRAELQQNWAAATMPLPAGVWEELAALDLTKGQV